MIKWCILFFILIFFNQAAAQNIIKGKVTDASTHAPLAFVNIIYNEQQQKGTTTDIHGNFKIITHENITRLIFSYVGYEKLIINIEDFTGNVQLTPARIQLAEVQITAGENPAHRIIKLAAKNRNNNNPEKLTSYTTTGYHKITSNFNNKNNRNGFVTKIPADDENNKQENTENNKFNKYIFVSEAVSERTYRQPALLNENIIATQISGFKNPEFGILASEFQPFGFYNDFINLLAIRYVNPIANNSINLYSFILEDQYLSGNDTLFIISYKPKEGRSFDGLKGLIYINSDNYAIQNVIAEPASEGLLHIRVQQIYNKNSGVWFPEQLNFDYYIDNNKILISGNTYYTNTQINTELKRRNFSNIHIDINPGAGKMDSVFWQTARYRELTPQEIETFRYLDSVTSENKSLNNLNVLIPSLLQRKIPIRFVDLEIINLFQNNNVEGFRPQIGLSTNNSLLPWISVGGFLGYGFKDKRTKHGAEMKLKFVKLNNLEITTSWQFNTLFPGKFNYRLKNELNFDTHNLKSDSIIYYSGFNTALSFRPLQFTNLELFYNHFSPYANNNTYQYAGFKIRYAYKETISRIFKTDLVTPSKYPVFYFSAATGLDEFTEDKNNKFYRMEAAVEKRFFWKSAGVTFVNAEAGKIITDGKYSNHYYFLFSGNGSSHTWSIYRKNVFPTMPAHTFWADEIINFQISHLFNPLNFNKWSNFKPRLGFAHHLAIGRIAENNQFSELPTLNKGYTEAGILLNNLVKFNYLNTFFLNFGVGLFYNYGHYNTGAITNDGAIVLTTMLTF